MGDLGGPRERSDQERKRPVKCNGTFHYMVTIKRNAVEFTKIAWLDMQLSRLRKLIPNAEWSDNVSYELDSLHRLHIHTIVTSIRDIKYKQFMRKGWHIHFSPFKRQDYGNILNYINKHNQNKYRVEQLEVESQIYNTDINNLFQDD